MPRLFLELKNDDSAETWTMEGGRQYLVIKKEEIVNALDGDGIDAECLKIKEIGRKEATKEMDETIESARAASRAMGAVKSWCLARKIVGLVASQRKAIFGTSDIAEIMFGNVYTDAEIKVDTYLERENHRAVAVKDYVGLPNHKLFGKTGVDMFQTAVVIRRIGSTLTVLRCDGITAQVSTNEVRRTGAICDNLSEFLDAWKVED